MPRPRNFRFAPFRERVHVDRRTIERRQRAIVKRVSLNLLRSEAEYLEYGEVERERGKKICLQRDPLEIRNKIDANPARLFPRSFREYSTGRTVNRSSGGGLDCFLVARRGTVSRTMRNGSPDGVQGRPCYFAWHRSSMKTRFVHRWTPLFSRPTELSVSRPMILFRWYTVDIRATNI